LRDYYYFISFYGFIFNRIEKLLIITFKKIYPGRIILNLLENLNIEQKKAVEQLSGPLLVLAGAGTGKTRVLTTRLCNILHKRLATPFDILTVTFTNKAANEMKLRVEKMLGVSTAGWWIGTFHSMGARILRKYPEIVGLKKQFTIIDVDDQLRIIKQILTYHNIDDKRWPAKSLSSIIQRWKDRGCNPENSDEYGKNFANNKGVELYKSYQNRLKSLNVVDYGDLLLQNLNIFKNHSDILKSFQNKFKFILVDEYQDTNLCQYDWLNFLAKKYNNICVVGDDDQSIYSWRGAEVGNILRFEKDYKNSRTIKLEKNYRSTGNILQASNFLISKNKNRMGKNLWTEKVQGEKIEIANPNNSEEEATYVSDAIENLKTKGNKLSDAAILVRASFQTRFFEERFIKIGLPYKIIGGTKFYERLEIKDALAYLRLLVSEFDDLAFERIINVPKRGLGSQSLRKIEILARERNISLLASSRIIIKENVLNAKANNNLSNFLNLLETWRTKHRDLSAAEISELVLEESGYTGYWQNDKSVESVGRLENLKELINAISDFDDLKGFLEHIQLVMDNNNNNYLDSVNLLTLHAAKGLEFEYVFLPGWEEEIFPNRRSLEEKFLEGLEEERRLAYVGITRAKKKAWITYVNNRIIHGQWFYSMPSRFIAELPKENINKEDNNFNFSTGNLDYQNDNLEKDFQSISTITIEKNIKLGMKVFHQKFGYGIVQNIDGDNAEVKFDKTNIKRVKKDYLSLNK